ncbi:MAG TPA: response regulator [candidate division Zixibacteria bacterium]|nr:response regulator [candidate division Zixibacteria bacterium]
MNAPAPKRAPVLVIEDEPSVMAYVKAALRRSGFEVECAESGVRALELLADRDYQAVVTDMRMPGGVDGADVYQWLMNNRQDLAKRLLFITGDTVNEETATTLRRTGVPCVEKPFRMADFISAVQSLVGADM